jgi:eukaryotic-like serine/threonine-protein kinase
VGTTISSGDTVTLTVAQGYEVPDVIGMTKDAAVSTLSQSGLVAKVVYVDADRTAGTVDSTDPAAGTQVSSGTVVTVRL